MEKVLNHQPDNVNAYEMDASITWYIFASVEKILQSWVVSVSWDVLVVILRKL